eukprot:CAMPEP_0184991920 /NCGR_PEP_ID=MMETSP1098-20130426/38918_1 /TAXON_ID=89044 /ORGANISM="Spumella elongata, Strain CCAP 955/1" /LENGTH=163 /DNA_ID=CAMNT_0027517443 /DNA_START=447 /DNA_END=937 /DNA_ORIENTATION=-
MNDKANWLEKTLNCQEVASFTVMVRHDPNDKNKDKSVYRINLLPLLVQELKKSNRSTTPIVLPDANSFKNKVVQDYVELELKKSSGKSKYVVITEMGVFLLPSNVDKPTWLEYFVSFWRPESQSVIDARVQTARDEAEGRLETVDEVAVKDGAADQATPLFSA